MIPESSCGLDAATQAKLHQVFSGQSDIDQVILYGSRAKGNFKPGSDIDLTIKSEKMNLSDLFQLETQLDDLFLPYKIDLSLFHLIENPNLIDHIQRVGIVFYQKISTGED